MPPLLRVALAVAGLVAAQASLAAPITLTLVATPRNQGLSYQQTVDDPCIFGNNDCKSPEGWKYVDTPTGNNDEVTKWSFGTNPNGQANTNDAAWTRTEGNGKNEVTVGPYYSYDQLLGVLGGTSPGPVPFFIGIDNNRASDPQYLREFSVYECGDTSLLPTPGGNNSNCTHLARFLDESTMTSTSPGVMVSNFGTGWSDYKLVGTGLQFASGKYYMFYTHYFANDGPDAFFLLNGETAVPCTPTPQNNQCGLIPLPGTISLLGAALMSGGTVLGMRRRRRGF